LSQTKKVTMSISNTNNTRSKTVSQKLVNTTVYSVTVLALIATMFFPHTAEAKHLAEANKTDCKISSIRPKDSKWILKNKAVSEGVRYTTDVYQAYSSNDKNIIYSYLLKDSTSKEDNKVIANFTLTYKLVNNRWNVYFNGCGVTAKKNKDTLIVNIYNDQKMLKSIRLNGNKRSKAIGIVRKPNANHIRVMNDIDITESK
jgi:hypothetical protein